MHLNYRDTVALKNWFEQLEPVDHAGTDLRVDWDELKALLTSYIDLIILAQKAGLIYG